MALPLAARGIPVSGIDASEKMVARLRAKPGGTDIPVAIGDFADVDVEGSFSLIYVPFTTHRYAGYARSPFEASSDHRVSVYRLPRS